MSQRKIGVFLSYVNIIIKNLVIFMYTPFLLRTLGQSEYGLYQMTNSVIASLSILSLGFGGAYVRFYTKLKIEGNDKIRKLNGMYMLLFIGMGLVATILGFFLVINVNNIFSASFNQDELEITRKLMTLMIFNIALTFPSSVFDSYIMVNEEFRFQQSRQIFQTLIAPILSIPLLMLGMGSISIVMTQTLITIFFLFLNMKFAIGKLNMKFDFSKLPFSLLKEIAAFAFFIFVNQVFDQINNNAPSFILGIFSGAKQVAIFAIAVQIRNVFFMLSTSISGVFIPQVNNMVAENNNNEALNELMIKVGRIQLSLLSFILGGFIVIGKFFINVWAGNNYEIVYYLIIAMVFPVLVPLSQNVGIEIQRAKNMHVFRSVCYVIFSVINCLITMLLAESYGVIAPTIGYIVFFTIAPGLIMNIYYHRKVGLNMILFWEKIANIGIPFIISIGILLIVQLVIPINSFFMFLLYGGAYVGLYILIYYLTAISENEKKLLYGLIRKRG